MRRTTFPYIRHVLMICRKGGHKIWSSKNHSVVNKYGPLSRLVEPCIASFLESLNAIEFSRILIVENYQGWSNFIKMSRNIAK
jgi:hypothetical protein